jgi:hypothetical protein
MGLDPATPDTGALGGLFFLSGVAASRSWYDPVCGMTGLSPRVREVGMAQENKTANQETEVVAERLRQLNERIIEAGRKAGGSYLDVYEQSLRTMADLSERAGQSQVEWVTAVVNAQADFMREMAKTYAAARR